MRQALQSKAYEKAVSTAEKMIEHGFVSIEAHVICAQAYEGLNNPEKAKFHHDVAAGLIRSIFASGDGKSQETAFEVIGVVEERVVMNVLGLPPFGAQSLLPGKPNSYDLLKVKDPRTGQDVSVFFNINLFFPPRGLR